MRCDAKAARGFTLIELLVVLAILGILGVVGVSMIGNRKAVAVRALVDELEGGLTNARRAATAGGRDITLEAWGTWSAGAPMILAFGDSALTDLITYPSDQIMATAIELLKGNPPPATAAPWGNTVQVPWHVRPTEATGARARIVAAGGSEWDAAMKAYEGRSNQTLEDVDPFRAGGFMVGVRTDANYLFDGTNVPRQIRISGSNQRFTTTFVVAVVGTTPNGGVLPGAAMGLLVVPGNGASIYKFYNPGVREGDGRWRRL